jgi:hypothetical protein
MFSPNTAPPFRFEYSTPGLTDQRRQKKGAPSIPFEPVRLAGTVGPCRFYAMGPL